MADRRSCPGRPPKASARTFLPERRGATSGFNLEFDVRYLWMRQKEILGSHFANAYQAERANELVMTGKIRPVLDQVFEFEDTPKAHQLMKENKLAPSDIQELRVHVGDFQHQLCQPIETRRKPTRSADANFSIPFCVAVAATYGEVKVPGNLGREIGDFRPPLPKDFLPEVPRFEVKHLFEWRPVSDEMLSCQIWVSGDFSKAYLSYAAD